MRNTITFRLLVTLLFVFAAAAFLPLQGTAFAAESNAPGGTVQTNDKEAFTRALDESATVEKDEVSQTLTVTLEQDIVLTEPLLIKQGSPGDKVVINLNGHSITGAAGQNGTEEDAAAGQNAIEIEAADFDVEIMGPGNITGGTGAVYETDTHFKSGVHGGDAVQFVGSSYYPGSEQARLNHGLTISGDAILTGGDGACISSIEWLDNIEKADIGDYATPVFVGGSGGAGIGQKSTGVHQSNSLSYSKIVVDYGTVSGGTGGTIDMSAFTPTQYALMTSAAAGGAMSGKSVKDYPWTVSVLSGLAAGRGGDGIRIGGGRKYIEIGVNGNVSGNSCGSVEFGRHKSLNQLNSGYSFGDYGTSNQFHAGDAGDGIAVWVGDLGLTNAIPGFTGNEWEKKTKDSDDMGIYVAGTVTGGSTSDTDALREDAGNAGAGIALYGDYDRFGIEDKMEYHRDWGIIDVEGTVSGGNGGSAMAGSGGNGGNGIHEDYDVESNDDGTNYYIINGTVQGGNGGDSYSSSDLSDVGFFGSGGSGIRFSNIYREGLFVVGNGTAIAGDAGSTVNRGNGSSIIADSAIDALYLNPLNEPGYYENTVSINTLKGSSAKAVDKNRLQVSASMTSFSEYPTTSTRLSCSVSKPSGYTGAIYVQWIAVIRLQENTPEICCIEPSGTSPMSFNLLSNENYTYLAYPKASSYDLKNEYVYDIATTDRIKDTLEFKGSKVQIYCYALLEDGRWGKSNVMEFDKNGWSGGSSPATDADRAAAEAVSNQIQLLSDPEGIGLYDEETVIALRQAYESLTKTQKALIPQDVLSKLEAAEAKITELNQAEADEAANTITALLQNLPDLSLLDPNDPSDAEAIADVKQAVENAVNAYNNLSDSQKRLIDTSVRALLDNTVAAYNDNFPDDPAPEPVAPEKIALTANMITVAGATYTGKALTPAVTVKHGGRALVRDADYTLAYANNTKAGKGTVTVTGAGEYAGTVTREFTISKAANPLTVKAAAKAAKVKYKKLRKKNQNVARSKVITIKKAGQGTMKYSLTSAKKGKKSFMKYFKINAKTGKVTVKKKLKKGTYQVTVKVTAAGNSNFKSAAKKVTFKVKVR